MKNQRYNLLTTLIVSALHPNEPQAAGTIWEPTNTIDIQEADELVLADYAEKIDHDEDDVITPTWLQRQDEAKRKAEEPAEEEPVAVAPFEGRVIGDAGLALILEGSVEQVKAELAGLSSEQLLRLSELEGDKEQGGKQRKGVADAIEAAYAELDPE